MKGFNLENVRKKILRYFYEIEKFQNCHLAKSNLTEIILANLINQNFKFKIQQKTFNKKMQKYIVPKILFFMKIEEIINKSLIIGGFLHFYLSKCDF